MLTHFAEDLRHLKRSCGVHIGGDDRDASVGLFGVAECECPLKVHLRAEGRDVPQTRFMNITHRPTGKCFDC